MGRKKKAAGDSAVGSPMTKTPGTKQRTPVKKVEEKKAPPPNKRVVEAPPEKKVSKPPEKPPEKLPEEETRVSCEIPPEMYEDIKAVTRKERGRATKGRITDMIVELLADGLALRSAPEALLKNEKAETLIQMLDLDTRESEELLKNGKGMSAPEVDTKDVETPDAQETEDEYSPEFEDAFEGYLGVGRI